MEWRDLSEEFSRRFAVYLEALGKSRDGAIKRLAGEIDVSRQAMYLWKRSIPSPATLRKLLDRESLGFTRKEQDELVQLSRTRKSSPDQMVLPFEFELPDGQTVVRIQATGLHPGEIAITMRRKVAS